MSAVDALFIQEPGGLRPTLHARGPWDPGALHAGPVAALLARAIEAAPAPGPMHVTRLTVELLRAVPFEGLLEVQAAVARPGRRVELVEASVRAGGEEACRARAWRVRRSPEPLTDPPELEPPPMRGPEEVAITPAPASIGDPASFGGDAVEHRFAEGDWRPGPARLWMRMLTPLIAGESISPLARTVALADFCNGVASSLRWDSHVFVNTDLTVHVEREAAGEWIGMDGRMRHDPEGYAVSESVLYDERGRIGRGMQSLYVARR